MLYNAHIRLKRIIKSTPRFSMHLVPVAPSEIDQFFDDFQAKPVAQRKQEFLALRNIHREYVIDLESGKGQPEPKVMPIPHSLVAGAQGSVAPVLEHQATNQLGLHIGLSSLAMVVSCMDDVKGATRKGLLARAVLLSFNQIGKLRLPLTIRRLIISG